MRHIRPLAHTVMSAVRPRRRLRAAGAGAIASMLLLGAVQAAHAQYNVGAADNTIGAGAFYQLDNHWQIFDVFQDLDLRDVLIYPETTGTLDVQLRNSSGTVLQSRNLTISSTGAQRIPLDFTITPGTSYRLTWSTALSTVGGLYRNSAGAIHPYTEPGVISITGNSFNTAYWYFFYDWAIDITDDIRVSVEGPTTTEVVDADSTGSTGDGEVLLDFIVRSGRDDWTVTQFEFTVAGSGNGATAFDELALYEDDGNDTFDGSSTDLLATTLPGVAFTGPGGTYTAILVDDDFSAGTRRRFFLVGKLNGSARAGDTFEVALTNLTATTLGSGVINGVPTSYSAGIEIDEARLEVSYLGPFSPQPLPFDATGPHGDGVLMMEVLIEAFNDDFSFSSVDIRSFGTGNSADHLSEIALYLDTGSGTWDGAAIDQLVASAPAFPTDNGTWSPSLTGLVLPSGMEARLYFVAILNGQAPNGAMFGATVDALHISSPNMYQLNGVPFSAAMSIVVNTPLTVSSFTPLIGSRDGGESIVVQGTGFRLPFSVRIDGMLASGSAQINSNGTEVTGLTVPPGRGSGLSIAVTSGTGSVTLTDTFEYEEIPVIVESFTPQSGSQTGGEEIVITGSGFRMPIQLTIGGVPADGSAEVNQDHTEITGFLTPAGSGPALEIVLTVEGVEHVLAQTFSYREPGSDDGGNCGAVPAGAAWAGYLALTLTLLALAGCRRLMS